MRSTDELIFRTKQEFANLRMLARAPRVYMEQAAPLPGLPDPARTIERIHDTVYSADVVRLADSVLRHGADVRRFAGAISRCWRGHSAAVADLDVRDANRVSADGRVEALANAEASLHASYG